MVGVPGRSRACQTCRERRVKCGLQRPICAQCAKKKRECSYERNHVFVHHEKGTHKTVYRKSDGSLARALVRDSNPGFKEVDILALHGNGCNTATPTVHDAEEVMESQVTTLKLLRAPDYGFSLQQALVATAIDSGKTSKAHTLYGLLSRSLQIDAPGHLYSAPLACWAAWCGRQDKNPNLINASHRFYVQALRETQKALHDPVTAREDATLAACNALGVFEALECPDQNLAGFRWHRDACCRLIELRGPEAHQTGIGHVLFVSMRTFGFLEALEQVHPTFFSTPVWMTVPYLRQPKTPHDKLVDILSHGPGVVRKAKDLEADARAIQSERKMDDRKRLGVVLDIARDLSTIIFELDSFYEDFEDANEQPLYWHTDGYEQESELNYPPSLQFQDLAVASALTLYWSLSALVWVSLGYCFSGCHEAGAGEIFKHVFNARQTELAPTFSATSRYVNLSADEIFRRCLDASRKVCQTTAYCTTTEALQSGPPRVSTALSIVIDVVRKRSNADLDHVYVWATRARRAIGEKWVKLMKYQP